MAQITLDMEPGEAIILDGALEKARREAEGIWRDLLTGNAPSDEQAAALLITQILARLEARLSSALYPPECRYMGEELCRRPVVENGLCDLHRPHTYAREYAGA